MLMPSGRYTVRNAVSIRCASDIISVALSTDSFARLSVCSYGTSIRWPLLYGKAFKTAKWYVPCSSTCPAFSAAIACLVPLPVAHRTAPIRFRNTESWSSG